MNRARTQLQDFVLDSGWHRECIFVSRLEAESMKSKLLALLLLAGSVAFAAPRVVVGVAPAYGYVAPAAAYVPPPVYVAPAPVYWGPRAYFGPRWFGPRYYGPRFYGRGYYGGHWRR